MYHEIIVIACVAVVLNLCLFTECGRVRRVVGGMQVECGTQPRVASLRNSSNFQHLCGATVVSPHYAITAAHCVHFQPDQYLLQLNNFCIDDGQTPPRAQVLGIVPNELYDRHSRAHDIALLRIRLDLDDVSWLDGAVLPVSSFGLSGECTIYGYGTKDPDITDVSETLLAAKVHVISLDECIQILDPIAPQYDSGMMCAVGEGADACQGDSGSPLVCASLVEAVSSYGRSCGAPGVPGVYCGIGAHARWIREHMDLQNDSACNTLN